MHSESYMEETQVSTGAETQNPAPEQAVTPDIATPETANAEADKPDEAGEQDPREKAVKSLTRRVDRITAARYQAEARAQQAAQEAEQLRQRLAQYEQPAEPDPISPDRVLGVAQQIAQQMREQERVRESVQTVMTRGKALPGWDEACNTVNEVVPFYENGAPTPFLRAVFEGDSPEKVLHYLGQNPDVAEQLAGLTPTQIARRLDRIERDLGKPAEPKTSAAPRPVSPVKATTRDTGGLRDDLPIDEWLKRFNASRNS